MKTTKTSKNLFIFSILLSFSATASNPSRAIMDQFVSMVEANPCVVPSTTSGFNIKKVNKIIGKADTILLEAVEFAFLNEGQSQGDKNLRDKANKAGKAIQKISESDNYGSTAMGEYYSQTCYTRTVLAKAFAADLWSKENNPTSLGVRAVDLYASTENADGSMVANDSEFIAQAYPTNLESYVVLAAGASVARFLRYRLSSKASDDYTLEHINLRISEPVVETLAEFNKVENELDPGSELQKAINEDYKAFDDILFLINHALGNDAFTKAEPDSDDE